VPKIVAVERDRLRVRPGANDREIGDGADDTRLKPRAPAAARSASIIGELSDRMRGIESGRPGRDNR